MIPGRNPILIRNVRSLTDARYFAAMEVDWISMSLTPEPDSFFLWHNLQSWISGVKLAAELSTDDESLIAKTIIDAAPDGLIMKNMDMVHLTGGIELFLLSNEVSKSIGDEVYAQIVPYRSGMPISHFQSPQLIFLECDWTPDMINELKNYSGGFSFNAVDEETLGIKDFSSMDLMLECIRKT